MLPTLTLVFTLLLFPFSTQHQEVSENNTVAVTINGERWTDDNATFKRTSYTGVTITALEYEDGREQSIGIAIPFTAVKEGEVIGATVGFTEEQPDGSRKTWKSDETLDFEIESVSDTHIKGNFSFSDEEDGQTRQFAEGYFEGEFE